MTITIDVPPEAEARLRAEAAQHSQDLGAYVGQVVMQRYHVPLMTEKGRRAWEAILDELLEGRRRRAARDTGSLAKSGTRIGTND